MAFFGEEGGNDAFKSTMGNVGEWGGEREMRQIEEQSAPASQYPELKRWLNEHGMHGAAVYDAVVNIGGVTAVDDFVHLEDEDIKELAAGAKLTILDRRRLTRAVTALKSGAAQKPTFSPSPSPQPAPRQQSPAPRSPERSPAAAPIELPPQHDPNEELYCIGCSQIFPASQGFFTSDLSTWYCGSCTRSRAQPDASSNASSAPAQPSFNPIPQSRPPPQSTPPIPSPAPSAGVGGGIDIAKLQQLAQTAGLNPELVASLGRLGRAGQPAAPSESDIVLVTRDNVVEIVRELGIDIVRIQDEKVFMFETFGKVNMRVQPTDLLTFAYFACDIKQNDKKKQFCMEWNVKHAFTKLMVDSDGDVRMESDIILPDPGDGNFLTRKDLKDIVGHLRDVWNSSILAFHVESSQFAEKHN